MSSASSLTHAAAGSIGSAVALSVTYPAYVATIRIQSNQSEGEHATTLGILKHIYTEEGAAGLFKGLNVALIAMFVQSGVYYFWFSFFCKLHRAKLNPVMNMIAGGEAGVATVLMTNPLWVINSRQITASTTVSKSFVGALRQLIYDEGLAGLYSGVVPALALVVNPALLFFTYTALTRVARRLRGRTGLQLLPPADTLILAALAKITSTFLTFPLQVLKLALQKTQKIHQNKQKQPVNTDIDKTTVPQTDSKLSSQGNSADLEVNHDHVESVGVIQCARAIWSKNGMAGFFRGIKSKLLQTAMTNALLFLIRERLVLVLHHLVSSVS